MPWSEIDGNQREGRGLEANTIKQEVRGPTLDVQIGHLKTTA